MFPMTRQWRPFANKRGRPGLQGLRRPEMSAHRSRSWIMCPNAFAQAPRWTVALLAADSPCSSTRTALPTLLPGARDAGSTTGRFRVQSIHAHEVSTRGASKYATTHASCDDLSTEFPCLNLSRHSVKIQESDDLSIRGVPDIQQVSSYQILPIALLRMTFDG